VSQEVSHAQIKDGCDYIVVGAGACGGVDIVFDGGMKVW
jgi:hypothetical protein